MGAAMAKKINNIIDIKKERVKYRFVQEACKTERVLLNGQLETKENVLILIERIKGTSKIYKVHPVTEYLMQKSKKREKLKYNSLKKKATYLVQFLNYVIIEKGKILEVSDICDLKFEHGVEFLNYYGERGIDKQTVIACEEVLKNFYFFLCNKEALKYISKSDFDFSIDESGFANLKSPFEDGCVDNVIDTIKEWLDQVDDNNL